MNTESPDDEVLMAQLRSAASRVDPVPPAAVLAARSAFAWRNLDAEVAGLTVDSVFDEERLARVRGVQTATMLTFDAPGLTVEVEVTVAGIRRRLRGQVVPPQAGRVEARHREGRVEVAADKVGRFTVDDLPSGPVSLRCRPDGGRWVETDWFLA